MTGNNYLKRTNFAKSFKLKEEKQKKTIAFATGGTGGHIFPAMSIAQILGQKHRLLWCVDERGLKWLPSDLQEMVDGAAINNAYRAKARNSAENKSNPAKSQENSPYDNKVVLMLAYGKQYGIRQKLGFITRLLCGCIKAGYYLLRYKVDLVVGFGGYASAPTLLAAWILRKPIALCEPNSVVGRVNRIFLPVAKSLFCGFPNPGGVKPAQMGKVEFTGIPIRIGADQTLITGTKPYVYRDSSLQGSDNCKILVIGGSQGASVFEELIPEALGKLPAATRSRITLLQQCRVNGIEALSDKFANLELQNYKIASFFVDIYDKMQEADIIIARAGASTLAEIIELAKASILLPLPNSADNHQLRNAEYLSQAQAGLIFDESTGTSKDLADMIMALLSKARRKELIHNLKKIQKTNAAAAISVKINKLLL